MQVFVRDNDVDGALRILKRKMQREGVFREMKRRRFYEKPSEQSAREKSDAIRRKRKLARKQMIREGLLPAPVKKLLPAKGRLPRTTAPNALPGTPRSEGARPAPATLAVATQK